MMKQLVSLLVISSCWLGASGQAANGNDSTALQQAIVYLFDGIAELDSAKIAGNVTQDFLLLEDGLLWNTDSLIKVLMPMKGQDFKRDNQFHFMSQEVVGNMAWVAYYNTANIVFGGQKREINWLESAVLLKVGETWKVKMLHSTMLRKSPKK